MTITEAERFTMHVELRKVLGDDVANTVMEHLPPTGWADVARKSDIEVVERYIERLERRMSVAITSGIGFGLALLAIQVQIMVSIARL